MHLDFRKCLFGGALFAAGLACAEPQFIWGDHDVQVTCRTVGCGTDVDEFTGTSQTNSIQSMGLAERPGQQGCVGQSYAEVAWASDYLEVQVRSGGYGVARAYGASSFGRAKHYFTLSEDASLEFDWLRGYSVNFDVRVFRNDGTEAFELDIPVAYASGITASQVLPAGVTFILEYDMSAPPIALRREALRVELAPGTFVCRPDLTTDVTSNGVPDGAVTLSDFSFYLGLWGAGDLAADVTTDGTSNGAPDGVVTLSDFSFYLALWGAGCP